MLSFIKALYFTKRFFLTLVVLIVMLTLGQFIPLLFPIAKVLLLAFFVVVLGDMLALFMRKQGIEGRRNLQDRLSNGDQNSIAINVLNKYPFSVSLELIDEIPHQFQRRDFLLKLHLQANEGKSYQYKLRPVERGAYRFGKLNVYASSLLGLVARRFVFDANQEVKVYPSFLQMRKYELLAISNRLTEIGIKKIRKISNNNEFEQVREYVQGDDVRTINWRATARRSNLMVNQYQDEKSQEVYSVINMGRNMKMPFEGMTLLDYSINASLIISNIAMYKQDKAGLLTFANTVRSFLPAERKNAQMMKILEMLYKQTTEYAESDLEAVYINIKKRIKKRSLILLYTNFEGISSMRRQLKIFKAIAKSHLLVVIFFKNTEVEKILAENTNNLEDVYVKTIAEKFEFEKRQIVKELQIQGIHTILTKPENLNVDLINKYLALKAIGLF